MGYPTDDDFREAHGWNRPDAPVVRIIKRKWTRPRCAAFCKGRPRAKHRGPTGWYCCACAQRKGLKCPHPRKHVWEGSKDYFKDSLGKHAWDFCKVCGIIKRADGKNNPCKGPTKLRPMESPLK